MAAAEPVRRTSEIEEPSNLYVIHPISAAMVRRFAVWGVKPNAVSLTGMLCGILAGVAYYHYQDWRWAVAGFLLMVAWHVMDGADGQLARLTHAQSDTGKVLDGICDYVTFTAVYVGLAITLSRQDGGWVLAVVALAGACHAIQAAAYEAQRQAYNFWGWGRGSGAPTSRAGKPIPGFGLLQTYEALQRLVAGDDAGLNAALAAALAAHPAEAETLRARYRAGFAPAIRGWAVLSSNTRTLAIFVCALIKLPMLYFGFEIAGFSLILLLLSWRQQARARAFTATLSTA